MIEVLANDVTLDGLRRVKVVSDSPLEDDNLSPVVDILPGALRRIWKDDLLGLYYMEAKWECREPVLIQCEGWPCARPMVLWKLRPGERVSLALKKAVEVFAYRFKCWPCYAFMRRLPSTIENGHEAEGMYLLQAEWVPSGFIAICEGEQYGLEAMALQE